MRERVRRRKTAMVIRDTVVMVALPTSSSSSVTRVVMVAPSSSSVTRVVMVALPSSSASQRIRNIRS